MSLDHITDCAENGLDHFMDRAETSKYLGRHGLPVAVPTLASWAVSGIKGPPHFRWGRKPLYAVADVDRWAIEQLGQSANSTTAHDAMRSGGTL